MSLLQAIETQVHGLEESGGTPALVLELVEGETLAERIARGPLPVEEALAVGRQVAEALEASHERGIVHRDLKPANVKLAPDGQAKVLDFGLAKALTGAVEADLSQSPTLARTGTAEGLIVGTAAYMSPEQARGRPTDRRTDVWAFGCVLYEMLTGRRAFEGETVSDILAAVLTREPDWRALPPATPAGACRALRRCLERDPKRRLHDIADARIEIDEATAGPEAAAGETPTAPRRRPRAALLVGTALVSAGVATVLTLRLAAPRSESAGPAVARLARLTHDQGWSEWPTWSPDGSLLAYASDRSGNSEVYVRRGESGEDVDITNDPREDVQPAFSPDGNAVAFVSTRSSRTGLIRIGGTYARNMRTYGGDLWIVPALGGPARRLAADANFPAWRPDGKSIVYVSGVENRRSILEVPADGGTPRAVLPPAASSWEITRLGCSPDGRFVSFETQLEDVLLMPAAGGTPRELAAGFGHAWGASSPRLYFAARGPEGGTQVQVVGVTPKGEAEGAPATLSRLTTDLLSLAVSRDGRRIAVPEVEAARNLTRLPLAPGGGAPAGPEERLTSGRVTDSYPRVSPDGRRVAYASDVRGRLEVAILDVATRRRERLQLPGEDLAEVSPIWMPDGKQLAISRSVSGTRSACWIVAVDGSRAEQLFVRNGQGDWLLVPSSDGRRLLYVDAVGGTQQLLTFDLATRRSTPLTDSPGDKFDAVVSPDGRWIALTAVEDGVLQLFRMPASGGPMRRLTTGYERMRHPFFSPDGRWIYVQPSHRNILRVRTEGGPLEPVTRFPESGLFLEEPTLSPDGRTLYYCRESGGASLWLMTLAAEGRGRGQGP